jgi:hypothetical protein
MAGNEDIPEAELLAMPESAIPPSSPLWTRRAEILQEKQFTELAAELSGTARPKVLFASQDPSRHDLAQREYERERLILEARERSERLLRRIDEYQIELEKHRVEIEARALQLHDGRQRHGPSLRHRQRR